MHGLHLAQCLVLGKGSVNTKLSSALSCMGPVSSCVLTEVNEGARTYRQTQWVPRLLPMDSEIWSLPQGSRLHGSLQQPLGWFD